MDKSREEILQHLQTACSSFCTNPSPETWAQAQAWFDAMDMLPDVSVQEIKTILTILGKAADTLAGMPLIQLYIELTKRIGVMEERIDRMTA